MTTARTKEKCPASGATDPGNGSTAAKDATMNTRDNTTALPDASSFCDEIDRMFDQVTAIKHEMRLIDKEVGWILDAERAKRNCGGMLTIMIDQSVVDTVMWLIADAWRRTDALADKLEKRGIELEAAIVAAERRASA